MFSVPDPLHAAVVHFPIVLVLLGAAVALAAAVTRRWNLPVIAAVLLSLGAVGAIVAVATGESEGELVSTAGAIDQLIEAHEDWAELTRAFASVAAVLAIGVLCLGRWPRVGRSFGGLTAVVAMVAAWCVFQTGHYGGQLVYRHGAGVNLAAASGADGKAPAAKPLPRRHRDDD